MNLNDSIDVIENGSVSVFGVELKSRNTNTFYGITRCHFAPNVREKVRSRYKQEVSQWCELDTSEYSPNANISNTMVECFLDRYDLQKKLNFLVNSQHHQSWDYVRFNKSRFFMIEFSHQGRKIQVLSRCPSGWSLKKKSFIFNLTETGKFKEIHESPVIFGDSPSILCLDDKIFTKTVSHFEQFFFIEEGLRVQLAEVINETLVTENITNLTQFEYDVQSSKRFLNLISDAYTSGYYTAPEFWNQVREANRVKNWLPVENDKLVYTKDKLINLLYIY